MKKGKLTEKDIFYKNRKELVNLPLSFQFNDKQKEELKKIIKIIDERLHHFLTTEDGSESVFPPHIRALYTAELFITNYMNEFVVCDKNIDLYELYSKVLSILLENMKIYYSSVR